MAKRADRDSRENPRHQPEPVHPDEAGPRDAHDGLSRSENTPYVPGGADERGNVQPSVPHEGFLGRLAVALVGGEAVVLVLLAVAGYLVGSSGGFTGAPGSSVLALSINPAHATLLLVTGVLAVAATFRRRWLRRFAGVQAVVYFLVFAFGTAYSVNTPNTTGLALNTPDHVLHAVLALIGFVVLMTSSARIVEPGPDPEVPYPEQLRSK